MRNEITGLNKDYEMMQEKFKRVNIVSDQIQTWAKRVYGKFIKMAPDDSATDGQQNLVGMFGHMNKIVNQELTKLDDYQKEKEENGDMDYVGVFTNFATQEFIDKNIRVRPQSGVTHDETKDGRQSSVSKGVDEEGETGAKDNHFKMAILELEDQRKKIKKDQNDKKEEELRRLLLAQKEEERKRKM